MKWKSSVAVLLFTLIAHNAFAAASSVTAATGGTNLSANLAANGSAPAYTTLGTISIDEGNGGARDDITPSQTNATVILSAPAGWEFQAGQGSVSGASGSITATSLNVTASTITLTFSTDAATNNQDTISISGIKVRAQNPLVASSPAGNITRTGGTATFANFDGNNLNSTNFGSLSETAAAANKLVIGTDVPAAGTAGVAFSPSPAVQIQDAYGNLRSSDTTTINATRNSGSGTVAMSGTTSVPAVGGIATFSNLKYNKAGETIAVDFGAAGLTGATSGSIAISAGPTSTFAFSVPGSTTAGSAFSITVTAKDSVGNDTPGYAGTVHFTANDGQAVLPGDTTLPGGTATLNGVVLKTAGSRAITATDTGNGAITGTSGTITVNADAVASLLVTAPATSNAGAALTATLTAKDLYGNTVTSYNGTVHFTSNDVLATLPSNYTFTGGDAGVHAFTNQVTLRTSGSRSIVATDVGNGAITGTTNVTVNAGNAAALAFSTQPALATAGAPFGTQPVIRTVDAFGNPTTQNIGNSKTVTITLQTGTGTLQGSVSINIGDNGPTPGTATFTNLRIDTAGSKVLRVSNNTYGTVDSNAFVVSPAAATVLVFTGQPGSATAGAVFGSQPVVQARDAFGNDSSSGLGGSKIVTIALIAGTGPLQGTSTFDIAGSGLATFTDLRIDASGTKMLRATAPGMTSGDSSAFIVASAAPSAIVKIAGDGQTAAAGSTLATDPSVRIEDAFGNPVQSVGVTFAPQAGSGSVTGGSQSTDALGVATVTSWTLGPVAGTHTLDVTAGALSTTFTATATCTYTTKASGNWNSPATWIGECVPTGANAVTIANGHTVTVTANESAASLTFVANTISSAVNINNGASLTVSGLARINAPLNANVESVIGVGNGTFNAGALELNGAGNRKSIIQIQNGDANIAGNADFPGNPPTQQINITGSGSFNIQGNFAAGATVNGSATSTIRFNGSGAQTLGNYHPGNSFPNVDIMSSVTMLGGLTIDNTLTINSGKSLSQPGSQLHLKGDFTDNGTFSTNGLVIVNGTNPQTFGGLVGSIDFTNLTMANAAGLTILKPISVAGTLTLTSGNISTGANSVTILGNGGVTRTSGHIIGYLIKTFLAATAKTFEVGTANGYSPVTVAANSGSFPTTFTATAIQAPHPNSPSASALQRYWTLSSGAITNADLTFNYLAGDVVGNELLYKLGKYNAGWAYPTPSNVDAINHVATATAVASPSGDFHLHVAATQLRVTSVNGGANPIAGTPFGITVQSVDAGGNPANVSSTTTVTLTLQTGTGPLGGTLTGQILANTNSVTISGVTYTKAESGVVVRATATAGMVLAFDDSDPFTVDPGPTTRFIVTAPASTVAGAAFNTTVTAVDAYDNVTPAFSGTAAFTSSDPGATLPANYAFTGGDAGSHTFSVTLITSGSRSVTATSNTITGFATVIVNAGPPNHFTVTAPASASAGVAFNATVAVFDAYNNPTPSYIGTVSFSSSDGTATVPANYTFIAGDAGSHTFSFTLRAVGVRSINAIDGSITGSANVNVVAGAIGSFLVEAQGGGSIGTQTAGAPFSIRITARDAVNNTATGYTGTATLSTTAGTIAPPSVTFTGADAGVKTVSVTVTAGGTARTITATDGAISGTSNAFDVNQPPGADLAITLAGPVTMVPTLSAPFIATITNNGPSSSLSATLALNVPSGWTVNGLAPIGALGVGASTTITLQLTAPIGSAPSAYIVTATVTGATSDPIASNNSASTSTRIGVLPCPTGVSNMKPEGSGGTSGDLSWISPNADAYEVYFGAEGSGCNTFAGLVADPRFAFHGLETGKTYEWRVVTNRVGCEPIASACVKFTVATCVAPRISGIAETASRAAYHVRWSTLTGVKQYDVQEAATSDFANATTSTTAAQQMPFRHDVKTATAYFYRVRVSGGCADVWSSTLRVVVQPPQSPNDTDFDVVVEQGSTDTITQDAHFIAPEGLTASAAGFTAESSEPWITVTPASGAIPLSGSTLTITANAATLPAGASTATVVAKSTTGATLASWPVTIHAMMPVEDGGKTATSIETATIAGVAHAEGFGSSWRSDIRVFNPSTNTARYDIWFTPSRTDGTKSGRHTTIDVASGATLALADVVRRTFGYGSMAGESATGAIEIRPANASQIAIVTSRTYNVTTDGTYGQYMPSTLSSEFASSGTTLSLQQVAQSKSYRTNLGLVEGSGLGASVTIRIFDASGSQLAEVPVVLGPFEQRQIDSLLAANGITADDARIEANVTSPNGRIAAYASVVDNATNDSTLVPGVSPARIRASRYVVPGVADFTTSRNTWRSDLRIYNAGNASVTANVFFYRDGGDMELLRTVTIAPGQVKSYDGVLRSLFDVRDMGGALHIVTPVETSLVVTARTYDQRNGGTYGQFIPAMLPSDATALGVAPLEIIHVDQSTRYRANVGLAEMNGQPATVDLTVTVADGRTAQTTVNLKAYEFRQIGSLLATLGLNEATNARITVRVTGGNGRVVAYASTIDNRTQDPAYIPGQ